MTRIYLLPPFIKELISRASSGWPELRHSDLPHSSRPPPHANVECIRPRIRPPHCHKRGCVRVRGIGAVSPLRIPWRWFWILVHRNKTFLILRSGTSVKPAPSPATTLCTTGLISRNCSVGCHGDGIRMSGYPFRRKTIRMTEYSGQSLDPLLIRIQHNPICPLQFLHLYSSLVLISGSAMEMKTKLGADGMTEIPMSPPPTGTFTITFRQFFGMRQT